MANFARMTEGKTAKKLNQSDFDSIPRWGDSFLEGNAGDFLVGPKKKRTTTGGFHNW